MNYHPDILKAAFRFIDKKLQDSNKSIRDIASEAALLCSIRIVDMFKIVQDRYNVDLEDEIKEQNKFFGYRD